jgi:hypothetical protein
MKPLIYAFSIGKAVPDPEQDMAEDIPEVGAESSAAVTGFAEDETGGDVIRMCVCSRVGTNLRPEQLIGEAFAGQELELPEDALEICRVDLLAEQTADGACVRQGDRRRRKIEEMEQMEEKPETAVSLISLGEIGRVISL